MTIVELRNWKIVPVIAGIAAVAALTVVLVLAVIAARDADVVARVNGEKIMAEDVAELQARYLGYGAQITPDQALEQLITERLLYQEAKHEGHLLTIEEAQQELRAQLGAANLTLEDFQVQLDSYEISYEEYLEDFRRQLVIDDYMTAEVPVPEVTDEEAREYYEDYEQQFPNDELPPFEEVKSQIIAHLEQEMQQEAVLLLIEDLREKADIQIYL